MAAELPEEFDVVILGTGLPESIVASACSRIGQRVLHLDARNYYGGNWASFSFSGLQSWIEVYKQREAGTEEPLTAQEHVQQNEGIIPLSQMDQTIQDIEVFSCSRNEESEAVEEAGMLSVNPELLTTQPADSTPEEPLQQSPAKLQGEPETETGDHPDASSDTRLPRADVSSAPESLDTPETEPDAANTSRRESQRSIRFPDIVREGRKFNIDLVSKVLYSRGLLIDLLIKSNVSRYTEFKNVTRILTYHNGRIEQVPCSRADVFSSKQLSMIEKRTLMKFLTFCADYEEHPEEYRDHKDSSFVDFLQSKRLSPGLQHFVLASIAMVPKDTNTIEGLKATQHFLRSLGRYGNTPFLFHMYGLGEIPQCFCRMSAVFGGIYCLHHSLQCLVIDQQSEQCKAVIDSRGKRISCRYVLVEDGYLSPQTCAQLQYRRISRAILITDRSVLRSESDQEISVVTVPSEDGQHDVHVTELSSSTNTCMKNTYLVHLWCPSVKAAARADLEPVVHKLFTLDAEEDPDGAERPRALWLLYFSIRDSSAIGRHDYLGLPSNVFVCSGPDPAVGYDHAVRQAETIFSQMYPGEEFCPPAPNPEDIVYDGEAQREAEEAKEEGKSEPPEDESETAEDAEQPTSE